MKKYCWNFTGAACTAFAVIFFTASCNQKSYEDVEKEFSEEDIQALSETMGFFIWENLKQQQLKLDLNTLISGIVEADAGGEPPLSQKQFFEMIGRYKNKMAEVKAYENLKIAEDFLAENKTLTDMCSLNNGKVQYITLREGGGKELTYEETPVVNYSGRLIDGTVFDSTEQRGSPLTVSLHTTIPGFKSGILGMKAGEVRRVFIHPALGYGKQGQLPPNSLLIFDVELVRVDSPEI